MTDQPEQDESYQAYIESCAKYCRCCPCCRESPCAGTMAGGMCDGMWCLRDDEDNWNDDRYEDD